MPYATFSQIEFVGMAADRDIVLACSDVRKRASSSSSTITLVSVRTETERLVSLSSCPKAEKPYSRMMYPLKT